MTPEDDKVLRMLAGANFGPGANVILPSGQRLDGDEAQALTGAYVGDDPGDATRLRVPGCARCYPEVPVERPDSPGVAISAWTVLWLYVLYVLSVVTIAIDVWALGVLP